MNIPSKIRNETQSAQHERIETKYTSFEWCPKIYVTNEQGIIEWKITKHEVNQILQAVGTYEAYTSDRS